MTNNNADATPITIFSGINKGVVFIIVETTVGRADSIIFIKDSNNLQHVNLGSYSDEGYQTYKISNGVLTVSNTGYGVGVFSAYYYGE